MKTLKLYSLILLVALSVSLPPALAQRKPAHSKPAGIAATAASRGTDTISAAQLRAYLTFIASDEMEGRDTPSRGLDTVGKFIAMKLTRGGFKPAGDDGTFLQKIALRREQVDPAKTIAEIGGQKFSVGDDFLPNTVAGAMGGAFFFVGRGGVCVAEGDG